MNRRRIKGYLLTIFVALFALVGYRALPPPFRKDVWINAQRTNRLELRNRMASDLVRRHLKQGMTRAQIVDLLGKPSSSGPDNEWQYLMGYPGFPWGLLELDPEYLNVTFDESGRLREAKVYSG